MVLKNLQLEPLSINLLKQNLRDLDNVAVPTLQELKDNLAEYYKQAAEAVGTSTHQFKNDGITLYEKIRNIVCSILKEDSVLDDIIDAVLKAIASVIPGGIIIGWIVKKLVKFFFNSAYNWLCAANVAM